METTDEWFCDQEILGYDEACVNLRTDDENLNAWLYLLSADCALVSHARTSSFTVFCILFMHSTVSHESSKNYYVSRNITVKILGHDEDEEIVFGYFDFRF